jgi:Na+(H+)/acetate symporter ActP
MNFSDVGGFFGLCGPDNIFEFLLKKCFNLLFIIFLHQLDILFFKLVALSFSSTTATVFIGLVYGIFHLSCTAVDASGRYLFLILSVFLIFFKQKILYKFQMILTSRGYSKSTRSHPHNTRQHQQRTL